MPRKLQSFKMGDVSGPPAGQPFIQPWRELYCSDAWRSQSINCRRLIDFLIVEHMNHGGCENGRLVAPWAQLRANGIGQRFIAETIREAEELRLIDVKRGLYRGAARNHPTRFRLTFLHSH